MNRSVRADACLQEGLDERLSKGAGTACDQDRFFFEHLPPAIDQA
jgi:hypothetical protein